MRKRTQTRHEDDTGPTLTPSPAHPSSPLPPGAGSGTRRVLHPMGHSLHLHRTAGQASSGTRRVLHPMGHSLHLHRTAGQASSGTRRASQQRDVAELPMLVVPKQSLGTREKLPTTGVPRQARPHAELGNEGCTTVSRRVYPGAEQARGQAPRLAGRRWGYGAVLASVGSGRKSGWWRCLRLRRPK
jgi:hypothetical protein